MKKITILALVLNCSFLMAQNKTANSLDYKTGIGLRIWDGVGLNLKTFLDEKSAIDLTGYFSKEGTTLLGNYEFHGDLSTEGNLKWYLGFGANVSILKTPKTTLVGVNGVVGLDYKFKTLPLNIAFDWQPGFRFKKGYGFQNRWFGLDVRYTL